MSDQGTDNRRWTIGGGYNGARHEMFVFEGPHIEPMEKVEVMPIGQVKRELETLRQAILSYLTGAPLQENGRFVDPAREALYQATQGADKSDQGTSAYRQP